ncbi:hypothetical protein ACFL5D_04975 [Candidatus Neomarinimicrobiota bacterium]
MSLSKTTSKHNYRSFLFHAAFLAFAQNFMDIDTVIPSMIVEAGGNAVHIGIMTAIMFGGSSLTQLFFAPFISNYSFKKKFLLLGINFRILSLLALGIILLFSYKITGAYIIWSVILLFTIFSLGGAFSNISYTDILGKSIIQTSRKQFFFIKTSNQWCNPVYFIANCETNINSEPIPKQLCIYVFYCIWCFADCFNGFLDSEGNCSIKNGSEKCKQVSYAGKE